LRIANFIKPLERSLRVDKPVGFRDTLRKGGIVLKGDDRLTL